MKTRTAAFLGILLASAALRGHAQTEFPGGVVVHSDRVIFYFFCGRYEENGLREMRDLPYYTYADRIKTTIEGLPDADPAGRTAITPCEPIPEGMYIDDHLYNEQEYTIWSENAAEIVRRRGWDNRHEGIADTIPPSPPDSLVLIFRNAQCTAFAWQGASDDVFLTRYRILESDTLVAGGS